MWLAIGVIVDSIMKSTKVQTLGAKPGSAVCQSGVSEFTGLERVDWTIGLDYWSTGA